MSHISAGFNVSELGGSPGVCWAHSSMVRWGSISGLGLAFSRIALFHLSLSLESRDFVSFIMVPRVELLNQRAQ